MKLKSQNSVGYTVNAFTKEMEEIIPFYPLINDIFEYSITDQHIRVLAMMFKLGGYTTLNVLTDKIGIAQPTISLKVSDLERLGYIRKNSELMPKVLVLTLEIDDLSQRLKQKLIRQRNAGKFLTEILKARDIHSVKETIIKAMNVLFPGNELLAKIVSHVYLHEKINRNVLIQEISSSEKDFGRLNREIDVILSSHSNIFNVIYNKHQKSETYVQALLPIELFVHTRLATLESIHEHYKTLLAQLLELFSRDYTQIIPHQPLATLPEIEQRITTCLRYYNSIKIIDNSIFPMKMKNGNLIELILSNKNFGDKHRLKILSHETSDLYKSKTVLKSSSVIKDYVSMDLPRDYRRRDFVLFEQHGCLVFPTQENHPPYYNISPHFIKSIHTVFNIDRRLENAN